MVGDSRAAGVCRDKDEIEASSPGGLYIRALIPLLTSLPVHHSGGMHKTDAAVRGETWGAASDVVWWVWAWAELWLLGNVPVREKRARLPRPRRCSHILPAVFIKRRPHVRIPNLSVWCFTAYQRTSRLVKHAFSFCAFSIFQISELLFFVFHHRPPPAWEEQQGRKANPPPGLVLFMLDTLSGARRRRQRRSVRSVIAL